MVVAVAFLLLVFNTGCLAIPKISPDDQIYVYENVSVGAKLGSFTVEDRQHPNIPSFTFSVDGSTASIVNVMTIGPKNFSLILMEKLDYDRGPDTRYLTITINGYSISMYLIIMDVNDEFPEFKGLPYAVGIHETHGPGLVFSVSAVDLDKKSKDNFTLKLEPKTQNPTEEYKNKFIMVTWPNVTGANIFLNGSLDFESVNFYHYIVIAKDEGGLINTADFFVTVIDIQDSAPYWTGTPYQARIDEENTPGSVLQDVHVQAFDNDKGMPNPVNYTIVNDTCHGSFKINKTTGVITTAKKIDRDKGVFLENNGLCKLEVKAQEQPKHLPTNSSTETVTITVRDINDNVPTFNSTHYNGSILENTPAGIPVDLQTDMNVYDIDQDVNSEFRLTIEPGGVFNVVPKSARSYASILITVKNKTAIDYERIQIFHLTVKAISKNSGQSSSASLTVHVVNVNDNVPRFSQESYSVSIAEGSGSSRPVITVNATDADLGTFGSIKYSFQGNTDAFEVNPSTGQVTTKGRLDRERRSTYFLTMVAEDGGGRSTISRLTVTVDDVNDNAPQFLQHSYAANIEENSFTFVPSITVSAIDADVGENGKVTYSIQSATPDVRSNLRIDPSSGHITVSKAFDYEQLTGTKGKITLLVIARDNGTTPKSSNAITVNLTVQDMNDEEPHFTSTIFHAAVAENTAQDHLVIDVTASDADGSPPNNAVFYSILTGEFGKFRINSNTGSISVVGKLDAEKRSSYTITVNAQDRGNPPKSNTTTVVISVTNINDELPTFDKEIYVAKVFENVNNNKFYNITAHDPDANSHLHYTILWSRSLAFDETGKKVNQNVFKTWFQINAATGAVSTKSGVDRERVEKCNLVITVNDTEGTTNLPQTATCTLSITILDKNDNKPVFVSGNKYTASIRENAEVGIPLSLRSPSSMKVLDKDKGNNSVFSLTVSPYGQYFQAEHQSSGSVVLKIKNKAILDYELHNQLVFKVVATETRTHEHHSSTATVTLDITDENDNDPVFWPSQYIVSINETNVTTPMHVMNINATDADSAIFGKISYSLQGGEGLFSIGRETGAVEITGSVDYETKQTYYLTVVAADGGGRRQTAPVTLDIVDVNDNAPQFLRTDYQGHIKENSTHFDKELKIEATDRDEENTPNSRVTYSIVGASPSELSGSFAVNPTSGVVSVTRPVDYEALNKDLHGVISVTLRACDSGRPALCSHVTAAITVQDINDFTPSFTQTQYNASIPENITQDGSVITVSATDLDGSVPNNEIVYLIKHGGADKFKINSASGHITRAGALDRESVSHYDLTVEAMDLGTPSRTGSVMVSIEVTNVNDEPPRFPSPNVQVSLSENVAQQTVVYAFTAVDGDQDARLQYTILWNTAAGSDGQGRPVNNTVLQTIFGIDSATGSVKVVGTVDRRQLKQVILPVRVVDLNAPSGSNQTDRGTLTVNIEDVNDRTPTFSDTTIEATVTENTQPGIPVTFKGGVLTVSDQDQGINSLFRLSLLDHNTMFEVVPEIVTSSASVLLKVKNQSALDYETVKHMTIHVVARETRTVELRSSTCTVLLMIWDANDNSPVFNKTSYTHTIPENNEINATVIQVTATDIDSPHFGMGKYILQEQDAFTIDEATGQIMASQRLNAETQTVYRLNVEAVDRGGRSTSVPVTVHVEDVNDNRPTFRRDRYYGIIKENSPHFTRSIKVEATDNDVTSPNKNFHFSFVPTTQQLEHNFTLDSRTGTIFPIGSLDYEKLLAELNGIIELSVKVEDQGKPALSSVTAVIITVEDENDEYPVFDHPSYRAHIAEDSREDTDVTSVTATDKDGTLQNNKVFYELSGTGSEKFRISRQTGLIQVAGHLDRETDPSYSLTVTATDRGTPPHSSSTSVHITVTDVNDEPPQFASDSYSIAVNETTSNGMVPVYTLSATDEDTNHSLKYSILWSSSSALDSQRKPDSNLHLQDIFSINPTNGSVYIKGILDRERTESVTLIVEVQDIFGDSNQTDSASLVLTVQDVNDNAPHFNRNTTYTASIEENMSPQIPITFDPGSSMTVQDIDRGDNSKFSLTLATYGDYFEIVPHEIVSLASVQIRVQNSTILDYEERHNLTLTIIAKETHTLLRRNSTASVFLKIKDANDNPPYFTNDSYAVHIKENAQNLNVIKTEARDKDSEPNGMGSYSLEGGEDIFEINSRTGQVYIKVANTTDVLDREKLDTYYLTIIATDRQGSKTTAPLTITLDDVNDNTPQFVLDRYEVTVQENVDHFTRPFQVQATDLDEPNTANSNITYNISEASFDMLGNFSIHEAVGLIKLTGPLDYEKMDRSLNGSIILTVTAADRGRPAKTATMSVTINVQDRNDETPRFVLDLYSGSVRENAKPDTYVTTISATDKDGKAPNNVVFYLIDSGGSDKFRVESTTGRITVQKGANVDREVEPSYNLTVMAMDRGSPALSTTATVSVTVQDVNDEPPHFTTTRQSTQIPENSNDSTLLVTFEATDKDLDSSLLYSILWNISSALNDKDKVVDIQKVKSWFSINADTGDILVNSSLDRETAEMVTLRIFVKDKNATEKKNTQTATGTLTVTILDVNDNSPEFMQGSVMSLAVAESVPIGTDLMTIAARDVDKDNVVSFSVNNTHVFNITEQGQLYLAKTIDREKKDSYDITVVARDSGHPQQTSSATVNIIVLDANDNDPVFNMSQTTFEIPENANVSTLVATLNATDKDIGPNAQITFTNSDGWKGKFTMNRTTGDIYLNATLDRETVSGYRFEVSARDSPTSGDSRKSKISITFVVTDINDNHPEFENQNYRGQIAEDAHINDTIKIKPKDIWATDKDAGINAKIYYRFEHSNHSHLFHIDETSGEVSVRENLEGLAENYTLSVIATDQGEGQLQNNATLVIKVLDKNLNTPKFETPHPTKTVPECASVGKPVHQFHATDADKDKSTNGKVQYRFDNISSTDSQFLNLDQATGQLTIRKSLDRENKSSLLIRVLAYDAGIPTLSAVTELTIKISDVNDHPPLFSDVPSKRVRWNVTENRKNVEIGTVKAYDPDSEACANYSIKDNVFAEKHLKIKQFDKTTAKIYVQKPIDREEMARFTFNITVEDCSPIKTYNVCRKGSYEHFPSDRLEVTVVVGDLNDNPPIFTKSKISKGLRQKVEVGKLVFKLEEYVRDRDVGINKVHKYTMPAPMLPDPQLKKTFDVAKYKDPFLLNENGTLKTNMKFSADMVGFLSTTVNVSDAAGSSTAQVKIYIIADYQVLKLTFNQAPDDLNKMKHDIISQLDKEMGLEFVINDEIVSSKDKDGNVKKYQSNLFVHAVNPRTEHIYDATEIRERIDFHPTLTGDLIKAFNLYQVTEDVQDQPAMDHMERLQYILGGIIAFLAFVVCLVAFFFFNSISKYKRKLKAATTEAYAMDPKKPISNGMFNDTGFNENPIFNKELGGKDFQDSASFTSANSLDVNHVGASDGSANSVDEQEVTIDLNNDDHQRGMSCSEESFLNQALRHHDMMLAEQSRGLPGEDTGPKPAINLKRLDSTMHEHLEVSDI